MINTIMTPTTKPHRVDRKRASTNITTGTRKERATSRKISTSKTSFSFPTPKKPRCIYIRGVAKTKKLLTNSKRNKTNFPNINIPNITNLLGRGECVLARSTVASQAEREREFCTNSKMRSKPAIGRNITCRGSSQSNRTC